MSLLIERNVLVSICGIGCQPRIEVVLDVHAGNLLTERNELADDAERKRN